MGGAYSLRPVTLASARAATAADLADPASAARVALSATYGRVSPAFQGLKAALADGTRSTAIQILGDSTGDDPADWPYRLAQSLAPLYPAWTVHHRIWLDATQEMNEPTVLQTGTAGARYLDCSTGATTRRMAVAASPHVAGVLDVRIKVSMGDWTPAGAKALLGKSGAEGQYGWYAAIEAGTGCLQFVFSPDGTAASLSVRNSRWTAPTVADGAATWLRWVFTPDNGATGNDFDAYQSTDNGVTWTALNATITTAGVTGPFNNSATGYEVGGVASGIGDATAKVYEVQIRDGLGGPSVVPAVPDLWPPYDANSATFAGAPILTFVNGSYPGATIAYLGDATRLPKMTPDYGQAVTFLSDSHNEGAASGAAFLSTYDTWRVAVEARTGAPCVVLTQNPETSGTPWYREHTKRRLDLISYARRKGLGLIDTYKTFLDAGWPGAFMADAVHPNAAGSDLWRDVVKAHLDAS